MFNRLDQYGNSYYITSKKPFIPNTNVSKDDVIDTFNFAYNMTFGNGGEHRNHRSGGQARRKPGEIFADTFQGKIAEFALYNYIKSNTNLDIPKPDLSEWGLNEWDNSDFKIGSHNISVKSTKFFGNLLLLETKDWNQDAQYIPNIEKGDEKYDFFVCIRIKPECSDIMKRNRLLYSFEANRDFLINQIENNKWECNIAGFITGEELKQIINSEFILPQNSLLNGETRMDATNYYVQMGDMHDISELVGLLN